MKIREKLAATSMGIRFPSVRFEAVFTTIMVLTFFGQLEAAVIIATSVSRADVGAAVASAANGDTVAIPAGKATWTNVLIIAKAITLQGAGIGQTIIQDGVTSGPMMTWTLIAAFQSRLAS